MLTQGAFFYSITVLKIVSHVADMMQLYQKINTKTSVTTECEPQRVLIAVVLKYSSMYCFRKTMDLRSRHKLIYALNRQMLILTFALSFNQPVIANSKNNRDSKEVLYVISRKQSV